MYPLQNVVKIYLNGYLPREFHEAFTEQGEIVYETGSAKVVKDPSYIPQQIDIFQINLKEESLDYRTYMATFNQGYLHCQAVDPQVKVEVLKRILELEKEGAIKWMALVFNLKNIPVKGDFSTAVYMQPEGEEKEVRYWASNWRLDIEEDFFILCS